MQDRVLAFDLFLRLGELQEVREANDIPEGENWRAVHDPRYSIPVVRNQLALLRRGVFL